MAFTLRVTETPPLSDLTALEQVVIVDRTGPDIPVGPGVGAACLVGEFSKGPFLPTEVTSGGELRSLFGSFNSSISQDAAGLQNGGGVGFNGNGVIALRGKSFRRLVIQRVDTEGVTTDGGTVKATISLTVTGAAEELDSGNFIRDLVIPAGSRFADDVLSVATVVVATSEDVTIAAGTASPAVVTANVFFVEGITAGIAAIDTVIDNALTNATSTVTAVTNSTAVWAPGTGATLTDRIVSRYPPAIDLTVPSGTPTDDITVIWSARRNTTIRTALASNAIDVSKDEQGRGRVAVVASDPPASTSAADALTAKTTTLTATMTESPGRSDRKFVTFPDSKLFVTELNSTITVPSDSWMVSTLSNFPEEKNPGARNPFIQSIQGLEDAYELNPLAKQDYINFKALGAAVLRNDRSAGWQFQSGVTSVDPAVQQSRAPIKRRRMADLIQDQLNAIGAKYNKEPATTGNIDSMIGEVESFLSLLLSPGNPSSQRIQAYALDPDGGNTAEKLALGIFTLIVKVQLLASLDTLVYDTTIGETVDVAATS